MRNKEKVYRAVCRSLHKVLWHTLEMQNQINLDHCSVFGVNAGAEKQWVSRLAANNNANLLKDSVFA